MDHGQGMEGMGMGMGMEMEMEMGMTSPPPSSSNMHHKMMMHMTFFWGNNAQILFPNWPGTHSGMYALALVFVFFLAVVVEWPSHSRFIKPGSNQVADRLVHTFLHAIRTGLAYMVMLAVMSFNVGVFLAAILGHTVGFLFFGSRLFKKSDTEKVGSDLPPMSS